MQIPTQRNTKLRRLVREVLELHQQPLSLQEIHARVSLLVPTAAFSTVYRLVRQFEHDGLVTRIDWRERGSRYEWAADPHHHLVCTRCGAVLDLHDIELNFDEQRIATTTGYLVKHHAIELEGICPACQKNDELIA